MISRLNFYVVYGLVLIVALGVGLWVGMNRPDAPPVPPEGVFWPGAKQVGSFSLADQHGQEFSDARLQGHWTMMFFGYTHCPDVCPVTLAVLKAVKAGYAFSEAEKSSQQTAEAEAALKNSQSRSIPIQYVFVTVDPERDTAAYLREYLGYFDKTFIGLRGSQSALQQLYSQLGVLVIKGEPDAEGNYLVDHTAGILLLDTKGRLVAIFQAPHEPDGIRDRFDAIRAFFERVDSME